MARAKEMVFTARPVNAKQALDWGLVSQVVTDDALLDTATALANDIVSLPPQALRKGAQLLRESATLTLDEGLKKAASFQSELQQLNDHQEAINAILEKRPAQFTDS